MITDETSSMDAELTKQFGGGAYSVALSCDRSMGRRIHGVDLSKPLTPSQAKLLVDLLDHYSLISFPGQGKDSFQLNWLERLANHFGAPVPHPKNYANYIEYKKNKATLQLLPTEKQTANLCNEAFSEDIHCVDGADSPAVYVVTNLPGSGPDQIERLASGLHWHTDIEFEPVPLSTSMFFVQRAPTTRNAPNHTWVPDVRPNEGFYHPDSDPTLNQRRFDLPLNGETAYADTAKAFADLSKARQNELQQTMVRRRLRASDPGWLIPLVYVNPRTGKKSLHSPIWASRGKNITPVTIDGLSEKQAREFLDDLECHALQSKYRYDHIHQPGDITIWSNFSSLHNAPPAKSIINKPEDARLMYRISCKGEPCYNLPRLDTDQWLQANIVPPYRTTL